MAANQMDAGLQLHDRTTGDAEAHPQQHRNDKHWSQQDFPQPIMRLFLFAGVISPTPPSSSWWWLCRIIWPLILSFRVFVYFYIAFLKEINMTLNACVALPTFFVRLQHFSFLSSSV